MSMFYECFNSVWEKKKKNMNTLILEKRTLIHLLTMKQEHDVVYRCRVRY